MSPHSYIVYIHLHIFLNIKIYLSWIVMNLYTQSHLFSIEINISCLHTVISNHTVTASTTQPHLLHTCLFYTPTSVISLYQFRHITSYFSFTSSYIFHTSLFSQTFPTRPATSPLHYTLHIPFSGLYAQLSWFLFKPVLFSLAYKSFNT